MSNARVSTARYVYLSMKSLFHDFTLNIRDNTLPESSTMLDTVLTIFHARAVYFGNTYVVVTVGRDIETVHRRDRQKLKEGMLRSFTN